MFQLAVALAQPLPPPLSRNGYKHNPLTVHHQPSKRWKVKESLGTSLSQFVIKDAGLGI
jgi:hypothetical protein